MVLLIRMKMRLLQDIYGFKKVAEYSITTDDEKIRAWNKFNQETLKFIDDNFDFFSNLPSDYNDVL